MIGGAVFEYYQALGASAVTSLAPYIPPSGTPWEAYLCDRFGYPIQNISRVCFGKQYTATLNRPAQFTFWAPSNDPKIGGLHTDGNPYLMEGRAIRVYRSGALVFTGHVWQVEDDGDAETQKTSVTCYDPLQWWTRRVARKMVYANLSIGSPSINLYVSLFTNKDDDVYTFQSTNPHSSTETARGLLNALNDYDGFTGLDDFYFSSIYRPNVATPSSVTNQSAPSSGNVNIAFANSRASDVLTALVGQSGNFDLEVVPTDSDFYSSATAGPFHGGSRSATFQQAYKFGWAGDYDTIRGSLLTKPWKTLALLKYYSPIKGSQQDAVVFGYDAYPHNVAGISRLVDLQNLTNNSVMLGSQNWAREVNVTSVQTYGAGMDVLGLSDIVDPVLLDALAAEEVQLGGNAKQTVQITPLAGARTPLPFDDFVLGDQVHVNAGSKLRGGFIGLQRVYGFVVDISDDTDTETLSSLVTSPQTG